MSEWISPRLLTGLLWIGLITSQATAGSPPSSAPPPSTKSPGTHCTLNLSDNHSLHLIWIPAGTFLMGQYANEKDAYANETPRHQVVLSQGFWLGQTAITQGQWRAVMHTEPWSGKPYVNPDENSPAVYISWDDTQLFVKQINALSGKIFRLPTEAEREYACRAGTSTRFYWGEDLTLTAIDHYAWWRGTVLLSEKKIRPAGRNKTPQSLETF